MSGQKTPRSRGRSVSPASSTLSAWSAARQAGTGGAPGGAKASNAMPLDYGPHTSYAPQMVMTPAMGVPMQPQLRQHAWNQNETWAQMGMAYQDQAGAMAPYPMAGAAAPMQICNRKNSQSLPEFGTDCAPDILLFMHGLDPRANMLNP
eukprot:s175_g25.t1